MENFLLRAVYEGIDQRFGHFLEDLTAVAPNARIAVDSRGFTVTDPPADDVLRAIAEKTLGLPLFDSLRQ